jgi:recombinational DNA repair ATPase RecF
VWISRVRVTGGFLGGVDIEFARGLNVVIGGRGAGKTTLLELIRHALGVQHADENRTRSHDAFIRTLLGNGEIVLDLESEQGASRIVVDANGGGRRAEFASVALMLGQNELEAIASSPDSRLNLIDLRSCSEN